MIRKICFLLLLFAVVYACDKNAYNEAITDLEKSINLVSPNGVRIASDMNELKRDIGIDNCEIVEIKYLESKNEMIADIYYVTPGDDISNTIIWIQFNKVKTRSETDDPVIVQLDCVPINGNCKKCVVEILGDGNFVCACQRPRTGKGSDCQLKKTVK